MIKLNPAKENRFHLRFIDIWNLERRILCTLCNPKLQTVQKRQLKSLLDDIQQNEMTVTEIREKYHHIFRNNPNLELYLFSNQ